MRQHAKKKHCISALDCLRQRPRLTCALQSWTKYSPKYWTVTELDQPSSTHSDVYIGPHVSRDRLSSEEEALILIEMEEEQRLLSEQGRAVALDDELDHDENTKWLRGSEWPTWFASKPIHLIVAAASLPYLDTLRDFSLGVWNGFECVSPAGSKRVI